MHLTAEATGPSGRRASAACAACHQSCGSCSAHPGLGSREGERLLGSREQLAVRRDRDRFHAARTNIKPDEDVGHRPTCASKIRLPKRSRHIRRGRMRRVPRVRRGEPPASRPAGASRAERGVDKLVGLAGELDRVERRFSASPRTASSSGMRDWTPCQVGYPASVTTNKGTRMISFSVCSWELRRRLLLQGLTPCDSPIRPCESECTRIVIAEKAEHERTGWVTELFTRTKSACSEATNSR